VYGRVVVPRRVLAQRRGADQSDATVDRQADNDRQIGDCAADGNRNSLHHVSTAVFRRGFTDKQSTTHVRTFNSSHATIYQPITNYYYYYYYTRPLFQDNLDKTASER